MTRINEYKLQQLFVDAPARVVLTTRWLKKHGISSKLAWWYVKAGWLERVAAGVYKRPGDTVTWVGAVSALEFQLGMPLHVGGKTALQLLGKAHYVPVGGIKRVELYNNKSSNLPRWFSNVDWKVMFSAYSSDIFSDNNAAILEQEFDGVKIKISAPERAIMEVLYHVPKLNTFEEAGLLMEHLAQLRPKVIQELLLSCMSIKSKRLFLYFAEKFNHSWLPELDLKQIELGSGKIRVGSGGKYIAKYKLSVPRIEDNEYEL